MQIFCQAAASIKYQFVKPCLHSTENKANKNKYSDFLNKEDCVLTPLSYVRPLLLFR
jgi:hypothetical protein